MKSLLVFDGNCLSQHLASMFDGSGLADAIYVGNDFGYIPAYRGVGCKFLSPQEAVAKVKAARQSGRKTYQVSQTSQRSGAGNFAYTEHVDHVLKFPHVQFYAMAPQVFQQEYGRGMKVSRLFDLDMEVIRACQANAGSSIDFATIIAREAPRRNIFHAVTHPSGFVNALKFRLIASQIEGLEEAEWKRVEEDIAKSEGINFPSQHPLSREVYTELGANWDGYDEYCGFLALASAQEWGKILRQSDEIIAQFGYDSQAILALIRASIALNDEPTANFATGRFLELSPGFYHSWLLRYEYLMKFKQGDGIDELMLMAKGFYGEQRNSQLVLGWINLHLRRYADAAPYIERWVKLAPDLANAIVPMLHLLVRTGRPEEASAVALDYVRGRKKSEFNTIKRFYDDIGGFSFDPVAMESVMV
ncbi:hypothetical protein [Rhizobium sp. AC27/96]|uniref:hypothetical protein n=1 Tax=Rhizobium sp. AC27/96 TaxID=1841653 RepID=UPI0008389097|nr:hypothetical protein [Rhizobium sp. AC27/96]